MRASVRRLELTLKLREGFPGEEGDLAFVVRLEVEEAVAANAASGDALDFVTLQNRVLAGWLFVVAEEIVAG